MIAVDDLLVKLGERTGQKLERLVEKELQKPGVDLRVW